MSWSMSGVPRIIQTKVLTSHLTGGILLIEPKLMMRPRGNEMSSVSAKSSSVTLKPSKSELKICDILNSVNLI